MIIEIKQPVTKEKVIAAIEKASTGVTKKNLRKHFGKLQRNLDSVDYQKRLRDEFI